MNCTNLNVDVIKVINAINEEIAAFRSFFESGSYEGRFFMNPISIDWDKQYRFELERIPKGNGIYVFSLANPLLPEECSKFNESDGTKIRKEYMSIGLNSGKILYIGSCKTMKMQERIVEHVENANGGVCSLRLFDEKRRAFANRVKIDCFVIRIIDEREEVPKLILPLVEEKLQKELRPACGRYRG